MGVAQRMSMFPCNPKPAPGDLSREDALYMAKKAEEAERYEEMIMYMKRIVSLAEGGDEMAAKGDNEQRGVEERNLISVGYKNIIAQEVFTLIEEVISDVVKPFVAGDASTKAATDTEVVVFFKKMEGDYNRYGAEITSGEAREKYKNAALKAYDEAQKKADSLPSTNPIRLGLALNFSVFYYEICEKKVEACDLAKTAFDTAIDHLDTLSEEAYKDSTLIMQLLKDNLTLWTENNADSGDDVMVEEIEN